MVNGFCFGGGFTQFIACDFAIAAEDATFGLSEVNWGIMPGGFVSWSAGRGAAAAPRDLVRRDRRDLRRQASPSAIRLINCAVPTRSARGDGGAGREADEAQPAGACATPSRRSSAVRNMGDDAGARLPRSRSERAALPTTDEGGPRADGMKQFLDEKTYRPGLTPTSRPVDKAQSQIVRVPGRAPRQTVRPEQGGSRSALKALPWLVASACAAVLTASAASAQDFPAKPVKVIVPFPPGGPTDVLARALGEAFRERTGADFRGRQQARRRHRDRRHRLQECRSRRLHVLSAHRQHGLAQSIPLRQPELRSAQGFRAAQQRGVHPSGDDPAQVDTGEHDARAHRLREGESHQAEFRLVRHRRRFAPGVRWLKIKAGGR